jgi:hypothetical protein
LITKYIRIKEEELGEIIKKDYGEGLRGKREKGLGGNGHVMT